MIFENEYTTIHPECCGAPFAVPTPVYQRWRRDHTWWHCPHCGSRRHFLGKSEAQQRIEHLDRQLNNERSRREQAQRRADENSRKYKRMRHRIQHGVCPDCNRTFQNLARHMTTEHPEIDQRHRVRHLRLAFGMTQEQLAEEIGLGPFKAPQISRFENGRRVNNYVQNCVDHWLEQQA